MGASRYTSIKTRIETPPRPKHEFPHHPSRYTSIKTRIETSFLPSARIHVRSPLATLPSKQGLKPVLTTPHHTTPPTSRYTSIKTRIETPCRPVLDQYHFFSSRYTSIKTRIETFPNLLGESRREASRYTSIKTRIETVEIF